MKRFKTFFTVATLTASVALAQNSGPRVPATEPVPVTGVETYSRPYADVNAVGVHGGINLAVLAFDLKVGHFYGFASSSVGVPLVSNGQLFPFSLGAGGTWAISRLAPSMWFFDLFGLANAVFQPWYPPYVTPFSPAVANVGVGLGVGFRYLHHSGFTVGFKLPVVGLMSGASNPAQSFGSFMVASVMGMPLVSFGYRF